MKPTSVIIMDTHPIIRMSIEVLLLDWPPESPDNQYHLFK